MFIEFWVVTLLTPQNSSVLETEKMKRLGSSSLHLIKSSDNKNGKNKFIKTTKLNYPDT